MKELPVGSLPELNIKASSSSSPSDLDFLHGAWKIVNRKLKSRLTNCDVWTEFEAGQECSSILNGFCNQDFFHACFDHIHSKQ